MNTQPEFTSPDLDALEAEYRALIRDDNEDPEADAIFEERKQATNKLMSGVKPTTDLDAVEIYYEDGATPEAAAVLESDKKTRPLEPIQPSDGETHVILWRATSENREEKTETYRIIRSIIGRVGANYPVGREIKLEFTDTGGVDMSKLEAAVKDLRADQVLSSYTKSIDILENTVIGDVPSVGAQSFGIYETPDENETLDWTAAQWEQWERSKLTETINNRFDLMKPLKTATDRQINIVSDYVTGGTILGNPDTNKPDSCLINAFIDLVARKVKSKKLRKLANHYSIYEIAGIPEPAVPIFPMSLAQFIPVCDAFKIPIRAVSSAGEKILFHREWNKNRPTFRLIIDDNHTWVVDRNIASFDKHFSAGQSGYQTARSSFGRSQRSGEDEETDKGKRSPEGAKSHLLGSEWHTPSEPKKADAVIDTAAELVSFLGELSKTEEARKDEYDKAFAAYRTARSAFARSQRRGENEEGEKGKRSPEGAESHFLAEEPEKYEPYRPRVITNTDPERLAKDLHKLAHKVGNLSLVDNRIARMTVQSGAVRCTVERSCELVEGQPVSQVAQTLDSDHRRRMYLYKLKTEFMPFSAKSTYSAKTLELLDKYPRVASNTRFKKSTTAAEIANCVQFDQRKAYSVIQSNIRSVPVLSQFDEPRECLTQETDDYSFYLCRVEKTDPLIAPTHHQLLSFNGVNYLRQKGRAVQLLLILSPCARVAVDIRDTIREIYADKVLSTQDKKEILNLLYGNTAKKRTCKQVGWLYENRDEALVKHRYAFPLSDIDPVPQPSDRYKPITDDELDELAREYPAGGEEYKPEYKPATAALTVGYDSKEAPLREGYRLLSLLTLESHAIDEDRLICDIEKVSPVLGIKTDALFVPRENEAIVRARLKQIGYEFTNYEGANLINRDRACLRVDKPKAVMLPYACPEDCPLTIEPVPRAVAVEKQHLLDEYDKAHKLWEVFAAGNTRLSADEPGAGKSYINLEYIREVERAGSSAICVSPWGSLKAHNRDAEKVSSVTLYNLLGRGINGNKTRAGMKLVGITLIHFEEIYLYNVQELSYIYDFMKAHPEIRITANGDEGQIEVVGQTLNVEFDEYYTEILDKICPTHYNLKYSKRVASAEDRARMSKILSELKSKKHARACDTLTANGIKTVAFESLTAKDYETPHVSYTKRTRAKVCAAACSGVELVGRKLLGIRSKIGNTWIAANEPYVVKSVSSGLVTLSGGGRFVKLPIETLGKHFSDSSCMTGHASQGLTLGAKLFIHDAEFKHASHRWLRTVVSRCTTLDIVLVAAPNDYAEIDDEFEFDCDDEDYYAQLDEGEEEYDDEY